jgi:DNA modification methylase
LEQQVSSRAGGLRIRTVPLDSLHADPANVRTHGPQNLESIVASLKRFGQAEPLVVQLSTGRIIGGNGRLQAMKQLGWTECEIVELDVDDLQATSLAIALNRTGELAGWDEPALAKLLDQLRKEDSLDGVGFGEDDIGELVAQLREEEDRQLADDGPDEPPPVAVAKLGDLWCLGEHRLLCGDSTKLADVHRVMAGDKAALVATDPPYLVDYTGERPRGSGKDWTGSYREIDIEDAGAFFRATFTNILDVLAPHAAVFCWHAHKRSGEIQAIWREIGLLDHQQIIWVKPAAVFGHVFYHFRHEPCMMGWRQGSKPEHDGQHEHDSVWQVDWDGKARFATEHPTSKPVDLFAIPMRRHTKPGDVVFEPFSGSGSQLIAAERTGRRCRAIEISPPFVDVALKRWQKATGQDATLDGESKTFAAVMTERGLS